MQDLPAPDSDLTRYRRLIEAARIVNSTLDLNELLWLIAETGRINIGADRGTLYLIDGSRQELWSKVISDPALSEIRLPVGKGIAGHVAASGEILNISDASSDPRFNPEFDRKSGYRTNTILCMPLRNNSGTIIGVFQFLNKSEGRFTADDEHFIDALSVHAALAIQNARLLGQEREKLALEKDLRAAQEVQMSLLPRQLPEVDHFRFAARSVPAKEVGGDYFDCIQTGDHRCEFVIADVSGKGMPAALLATMGKGVLYSQAILNIDPALQLKGSNRIIRHLFPAQSFITMMIALVDDADRSITVANAGHCLPLLYRSSAQSIESIPVRGMALNFSDEFSCGQEMIRMEAGDCVVLYSDGVTEARSGEDTFFEWEGLAGVIREFGHLGPSELLETLLNRLTTFADGGDQSDDTTVIIIKCVS